MSQRENTVATPSSAASHWDDLLRTEFVKESDRAAVILTAAMIDDAIAQLLRISLVASPTREDPLFDSPNAPLGNLSARIDFAFRCGLISRRLCRDLHIIRAIRNAFAHNVSGCTFEEPAVRSRVMELSRSTGLLDRNPKIRKGFPVGVRGDFLMLASAILFSIHNAVELASAIETPHDEWVYAKELSDADDAHQA